MELAGGENIFNDVEDSYVRVGWEDIIAHDPEWMVIGVRTISQEQAVEYLTTSPDLQNLSAVRDRNFVFLPSPFTEPSTRNIDVMELFARSFHPDRFDQ